MKRVFTAAVVAAIVWLARPVAAQTPAGQPAAAPQQGNLFIALAGGVGAVQKASFVAGAEVGAVINRRLDVFGEGLFLQNVVNRRQLDTATQIAGFLQTSQGGTAAAAMDAPAGYFGGGIRVALNSSGSVRPYIAIGGGLARVALQPAFTLNGADVTTNLPQYGVTLGSDLTGTTNDAAISAAFGVRLPHGRWSIDAEAGVLSIQTSGQNTNVVRVTGRWVYLF